MAAIGVQDWAPFKIDALGLVTLLGADECDLAIGSLQINRWTDGLPLLGAYKVAGDNITKPIPGLVAYNITDGIMATDVPGWFSRWLLLQKIDWNTTTFSITFQGRRSRLFDKIITHSISVCLLGGLLAISILSEDWWACVNVIAMIVSVLVRQVIVAQNRAALNRSAIKGKADASRVKSFWTLPTGQAVTINCSRSLLVGCLLTTPVPSPRLYQAALGLGWVAFGAHIITLGMACLMNQILTVVLLVVATVVTVKVPLQHDVCDDIRVVKTRLADADFRATAYANLKLTEEEEGYMRAWNLFPQQGNTRWWDKYRAAQTGHNKGFSQWGKVMTDVETAKEIV